MPPRIDDFFGVWICGRPCQKGFEQAEIEIFPDRLRLSRMGEHHDQ